MSYHSELAAERGSAAPDDDAITAAERRGAREALTQFADECEATGRMGMADEARAYRDLTCPALTPTPREWWGVVFTNGLFSFHTSEAAARSLAQQYPTRTTSGCTEVVHVREVRPLTAAQVEAMEVATATAWYSTLGHSGKDLQSQVERRRTSSASNAWRAQTRAALAHLGIPYEEDKTNA